MDEAVQDLVVAPFAEIVEKGKTALANAKEADNQPMLKAAQTLLREGERALKKIEPLCTKQLEEFSTNFVDALKENDDIAQYRGDLNELLWEFDDYLEAEDFDPEKFAELQALSRKAAPRILDILMRMKLEPPVKHELPTPLASPNSENGPSAPAPDVRDARGNASPGPEKDSQHGGIGTVESIVMGSRSGPDLGLDGDFPRSPPRGPSRTDSKRSDVSSIPEDAPPEPETNPWHVGVRPKVESIPEGNEVLGVVERRKRVSTRADSPTLPPSPLSLVEQLSPRRYDAGVDPLVREPENRRDQHPSQYARPSFTTSRSAGSTTGTVVWRPTASFFGPSSSTSPPPHQNGSSSSPPPYQNRPNPSQFHPGNGQLQPGFQMPPTDFYRHSLASSTDDSRNSSLFECYGGESVHEAVSPATTTNRASLFSRSETSPVITVSSTNHGQPMKLLVPPPIPEQSLPPSPADHRSGLEPVNNGIVDGLIPVDSDENHVSTALMSARQPDCSIGPGSSITLLKGFCNEAKEVQRGGVGVKQTKKILTSIDQSYAGTSAMAAKCRNCFFELEWKQVEADRQGAPNVNYKSNGVEFRLRFLLKSHIYSKTVEERWYGCVFCSQLGRTPEESDATVFFTQAQLFAHLARHPRPLPVVPGFTVIDAPEIPPAFRNDYDIHFMEPPRPNIMEGIKREIQQLPAGTAVEACKLAHGALRRPPGGGEPLQFAVGARIVGIEFPAKYNGEWAIGWADHHRAAFPADAVKIDAPPKSEIRMQPSSPLLAKVRWKWNAKDQEGGDWLKLAKNETITNISWSWQGHWCWSGTNSKGKWGIFPQSHLDLNSLRETRAPNGDEVSIKSHDRKISAGGLLSKISIRGNAVKRSGSSAGSSSSQETAYATTSPIKPTLY